MRTLPFFGCILLFFLFSNCKEDIDRVDIDQIKKAEVLLNPKFYAPLSAILNLETSIKVTAQLKVIGKNGISSDVVRNFTNLDTTFKLPILGLYPDYLNQVELTLFDKTGSQVSNSIFEIQTEPLIADLPKISIEKLDASAISPGWNLVNYHGHNGFRFPQRPFMFDEFGDIRWYLDFLTHVSLKNLIFDVGSRKWKSGF